MSVQVSAKKLERLEQSEQRWIVMEGDGGNIVRGTLFRSLAFFSEREKSQEDFG